MRLVTFQDDSGSRFGVLEGETIRDVARVDPSLPIRLLDVIGAGSEVIAKIEAACVSAPQLPVGEVQLLAPIPVPRHNILAVGRNFRDHAQEFTNSGFDASEKAVVPEHPVIFTKAVGSVIGPGEAIDTSNDPSNSTDYEGELGVIIGKRAKKVTRSEVFDHIFGYTIINDVTARHLQAKHVQWFVGKSPDTFCPMGPCIVTRDEISDLSNTRLRTVVNGETRQSFVMSDMVFDIPTLVSTLSEVMTLEPGDVLATGTGLGVGIGFDPPRFLVPGDLVEIEVDGIGKLSNPVV